MDLNELEFTPAQLAELYGQSVILTEPQAAKKPVAQKEKVVATEKTIPFKGKNKKGMLWVVHEPEQVYLSDADFTFLSQIITACKMNMDDVALINAATKDFTIAEAVEYLKPDTIILCGVPHLLLPVPVDEYILYPHQKRNYFVCDSLQELQNDKVLKSKLWLVLKDILGI
jgi:hypothetical protein